jgi:hypothetical protein
MHNLSRRHLVTAAAALPALAGSAFAADHPDAKFVALGERLKVANAEADRLGKPVHRLHGACMKAARFEEDCEPYAECFARFDAKSKETGYSAACDKWNVAVDAQVRIARAILKIPSSSRIGDGIRVMAAMVDHQDIPCQKSPMLWKMAVRVGFDLPAWISKDLGRMTSRAREAVRS